VLPAWTDARVIRLWSVQPQHQCRSGPVLPAWTRVPLFMVVIWSKATAAWARRVRAAWTSAHPLHAYPKESTGLQRGHFVLPAWIRRTRPPCVAATGATREQMCYQRGHGPIFQISGTQTGGWPLLRPPCYQRGHRDVLRGPSGGRRITALRWAGVLPAWTWSRFPPMPLGSPTREEAGVPDA
jgi:hypothetical protein